MKKYKKILKIVLNVFIWIFVAFSVFMTVLALAAQSNADGVPALGGKCFLTIASNSMSPTFVKGDLIFGQMLTTEEKQQLKVDDVITFYADLDGNGRTELNSHRIIEVRTDSNGNALSYVTKGDNPETNTAADAPVPVNNVVCKWDGTRIGVVGGAIAFLQTSTGFLLLIVLPLVVFFVYELYLFIKTLLEVKKKEQKNSGISAEEEEEIKRKAIEEYLRQQKAEESAAETAKSEDKSE